MRGLPGLSKLLLSSVINQQQTHINMSSCVNPLSFAIAKYANWVAQMTETYFSQLWRLKARDQGASMVGFS